MVYVPGEDCAVELKTHTELFDLLEYNIENEILDISLKSFKINKRIKTLVLTIQAPVLELVSISGACDFTAKEGIIAEAMSIKASGASDISINGAVADTLTLKISGASDVTFDNSKASYMGMTVSGASDVTIDNLVASYLDMTVSGASDITIKDLYADYLNVIAAGAADLKFTGEANESKFKLKDGSDLNIKGFKSHVLTTTETSGSSTIRQ